jgi:hypothetical protein
LVAVAQGEHGVKAGLEGFRLHVGEGGDFGAGHRRHQHVAVGAVARREVREDFDAGVDALTDIVGRLRAYIVGPDEIIAWARIDLIRVVAAMDGIIAVASEQSSLLPPATRSSLGPPTS